LTPEYYQTLVSDLGHMPGADAAALSVYYPTYFGVTGPIPTEHYTRADGAPAPEVAVLPECVSPGFFDLFRVPRLQGGASRARCASIPWCMPHRVAIERCSSIWSWGRTNAPFVFGSQWDLRPWAVCPKPSSIASLAMSMRSSCTACSRESNSVSLRRVTPTVGCSTRADMFPAIADTLRRIGRNKTTVR